MKPITKVDFEPFAPKEKAQSKSKQNKSEAI
jgi:hypothetical protein